MSQYFPFAPFKVNNPFLTNIKCPRCHEYGHESGTCAEFHQKKLQQNELQLKLAEAQKRQKEREEREIQMAQMAKDLRSLIDAKPSASDSGEPTSTRLEDLLVREKRLVQRMQQLEEARRLFTRENISDSLKEASPRNPHRGRRSGRRTSGTKRV